jgi:hypothetical protein
MFVLCSLAEVRVKYRPEVFQSVIGTFWLVAFAAASECRSPRATCRSTKLLNPGLASSGPDFFGQRQRTTAQKWSLRMKSFLKLRCPKCGDVTEHRRHCTICSHPLPEQPVAWGKFVIPLYLTAQWVGLTHIQWA